MNLNTQLFKNLYHIHGCVRKNLINKAGNKQIYFFNIHFFCFLYLNASTFGQIN